MFKAIEKYRTPSQVVLGLIGFSFIGFGVLNFQTGANNQYLVKIGDQVITRHELDQAVQNTQATGDLANREQVFQSLVTRAYLMEGAKRLGVVVSDEQIKQMIVDTPQFHDANKQFNPELFKQFLESAHLSEAQFMQDERQRQTLMQMFAMFNQGVASDVQIDSLLNTMLAPRVLRNAILPPEAFASEVKTDDEALKKYYDANQKNYIVPQAVKFEFIRLSSQDLIEKQNVTEEEIQKALAENQSKTPAKRRISHILFNAPSTASADEKANAKVQAEKIAEQLKSDPTKFAELAKSHSQDTGSANKGGDLGEFTQNGSLGSKALEDTAFSLEKGAVSGVVESEFGYHIVQVTEIQTDDEAAKKEKVIQDLKERKAQQEANKLREELAQLTFDKPDELKSSADKTGLTVQTHSDWLSRNLAASQKIPQAVVDMLFSDDVFNKKRNSEPVNANGETWFVRAIETRNESTEPFEQIKERVKNDYVRSESVRLATEEGKKILADLQAGKNPPLNWSAPQEAMPEALKASVPPATYEAIMKAVPKNGKPAYTVVELMGVPHLLEVQTSSAITQNAQARTTAKQIFTQIQGDSLLRSYVDSLRSQIKTEQGAEKLSDD